MPDIQATYIEVSAEVRYWEDSKINGVEDENGTLTPFRSGDLWCPVIRLEDGTVMDWPAGMVADFHFKVCDAGQYWLLDDSRKRVARSGLAITSRMNSFARPRTVMGTTSSSKSAPMV
ncbi:hypothetical protein [Pseudomonas aeruginosa]|uniref:hypothetical protein n=1 Tax=Pseudomonas aeruginosa TaxID=287 RepID=UPI002657B180|nr:hypothetical protein [Pseudomonas aeruginosa]